MIIIKSGRFTISTKKLWAKCYTLEVSTVTKETGWNEKNIMNMAVELHM